MNREDIFEFMQGCLLYVDGGDPEYYGIKPELSKMAIKMTEYLKNYQLGGSRCLI